MLLKITGTTEDYLNMNCVPNNISIKFLKPTIPWL